MIWLDIARLLERACLGRLTGIDRVELAYAERLPAERTRFVVFQGWPARLVLLPTGAARRFVADLRRAWRDGRATDCRGAAARLLALATVGPAASDPNAVYLLVSHRHLDRPAALGAALRRARVRFVPLIHDVIPLTHPEYGRKAEAARHARRIASVATLADLVLVNSQATGAGLAPYLPADLAVRAVPLGVAAPLAVAPEDGAYFLCVGTIEPRKNHLLLLHLWRRLGARVPRLVLVGHRGWENENVLDLLDRCPALRGRVTELGSVPDIRLGALLAGARALLMPSFAEGFGLPVAEALAHGTPVLCSDLPALREAGGAVPEYLDPLDGAAWEAAVLDYATPGSARRAASVARMAGWRGIGWDSHVGAAVGLLEAARKRAPGGGSRCFAGGRRSNGTGVLEPDRLRLNRIAVKPLA